MLRQHKVEKQTASQTNVSALIPKFIFYWQSLTTVWSSGIWLATSQLLLFQNVRMHVPSHIHRKNKQTILTNKQTHMNEQKQDAVWIVYNSTNSSVTIVDNVFRNRNDNEWLLLNSAFMKMMPQWHVINHHSAACTTTTNTQTETTTFYGFINCNLIAVIIIMTHRRFQIPVVLDCLSLHQTVWPKGWWSEITPGPRRQTEVMGKDQEIQWRDIFSER